MGKHTRIRLTAALLASATLGCSTGPSMSPFATKPAAPAEGAVGSLNPASGPRAPGAGGIQKTGALEGFKIALTENPVSRALSSSAKKTASVFAPKPKAASDDDAISLGAKSPEPSAELYLSMARVQAKSGALDQAAAQYQKTLAIDPQHVEAQLGLAEIRERQGRHDEALKLYSKVLQKHPTNLDALLGVAHFHDSQGKLAEAQSFYERAVKAHQKSAKAWNDLGLCYARQQKLEASLDALEHAIELDPEQPLYRNNIATVLTELDRTDDALAHLAHAHGEAAAHYNLGYLMHERGDVARAVQHFQQALSIDPSLDNARLWLEKLDVELPARRPNYPRNGTRTAVERDPGRRSASVDSTRRRVEAIQDATGMPVPAEIDLDVYAAAEAESNDTEVPSDETTNSDEPPLESAVVVSDHEPESFPTDDGEIAELDREPVANDDEPAQILVSDSKQIEPSATREHSADEESDAVPAGHDEELGLKFPKIQAVVSDAPGEEPAEPEFLPLSHPALRRTQPKLEEPPLPEPAE